MAFDELLADRVRQSLKAKKSQFEERKMFGGLCFMVDQKMCVGVEKERLMIRLDPDFYEEALKMPGAHVMDFTKRPMKGFVYVDNEAVDLEEDLDKWVQYALDFNPIAKASKKKKVSNV